jgi:mRNA-degrading endonuclease RelE of RelBE toxin-antitoxin system
VYEIIITETYRKKAVKFFKKHPALKEKYKKTVQLLKIDPFHEVLECKKMKGYPRLYRIKVTMHARIVIEIIIKERKIIPINIDTRQNIY